MTTQAVLIIFLALVIKHFVVDFLLQSDWQVREKGYYGKLGGIVHSSLHSVATLLVVTYFVPLQLALLLAFFDFFMHYHVDWAKMQINRRLGLTPADHRFWHLLGIDQLLHYLTYVGIVAITL